MTKNYKGEYFKNDLIAGLSVAALSLPQVMAYAMIAGLNPVYGIYTFIVSTIVSTFTGTSNYMIVGPTNIVAVTLAGTMNSMNTSDPAQYLQGILIITFLTGIIQITIGSFKLGYLVNFISSSVISGLTYGVALIILTSQFITFLDLNISSGNNVISALYNTFIHISQANLYSLSIGTLSIIVIILSKKYLPKLPSYLIAIGLSVIFVVLFNLTEELKVVGTMQSSIPKFNFFKLDFNFMSRLLSSAFSLAIISCIQILAIIKMMEKTTGEEAKINKEFIGQGITNVVCSFFNSFAITGSFTKSFANYEAGAKTRISELISGVSVLLIVVLLAPVVKFIPISTLAGIVIYVAFKMFNVKEIKKNILTTRFDAIIFTITFLTTILTPRLDYAIYFGVVISGVLILKDTSEIEYSFISYNKKDDQFITHQNIEEIKDDDYIIINLTGEIHFNAAEFLKTKLNKSYIKNKTFIIRMRRTRDIDLTVIEELDKFIENVQSSDGRIILSGMSLNIFKSLKAYGIIEKLNEEDIKFHNENLYSSTKKAIKEANNKETNNK